MATAPRRRDRIVRRRRTLFHLANLRAGERVVDLGSGSGMDRFIAALKVGPSGAVVGVDMTDAQLAKAIRLADARGRTRGRQR